MAIINRGIFQLTDTVFERTVGNDWPTAQVLTTFEVAENSNLYYTNARVAAYVTSLGLGGNIAGNTTTDLAEGNNLYYTNARVQSKLAEVSGHIIPTLSSTYDLGTQNKPFRDVYLSGSSINLGNIKISDRDGVLVVEGRGNVIANVRVSLDGNDTDQLIEGTSNLYYTNARVAAYLQDAGTPISIGDLYVSGNLIVDGDTTTLNTATLIVEDKNIVLANGATNATIANGAGITVDGAQANITYVSSSDKWQFNKQLIVNNYDVLTTANTTTDLAEGNNLYYTNARVYANVQNTSVNVHSDIHFDTSLLQEDDILIWDGSKFIAQQVNSAVAANVAEYVLSLSLNDTDDLNEGNTNLYFTEQRVIDSLTPGRGISISQTGIISSQDDSADFNLLLDGGFGSLVPGTLSNVLVFPTPASTSDRFILRTIQIANISDEEISISGNMTLTGNTVSFANKVPIPVGGSIEFLKRAHAFNRNDCISMVGYAANGSPVANLAAVSFAYETVPTTAGLFSTGIHIASGNVNNTLFDTVNTYAVIESLKLVNLNDSEETSARVIWADSNSNVISYFAYNLPLPPNSSVEVLSATKRINTGNKILVRTNSDVEISAIVSGRLGDVTQLLSAPTTIVSGQSSSIYWETDVPDGSTIYYSIE